MRRGWVIAAAICLVAISLYVLSATLFADSLRRSGTSTPTEVPPRGILLTLTPESITPETGMWQVIADLDFDDFLVDPDTGRMARDLVVRFSPALAGEMIVLARGDLPPEPRRVQVPVDGAVQRYPFDDYTTTLIVTADAAGLGQIVGGLADDRGLPGWSFRVSEPDGADVAPEGGYLVQQVLISRAGSTVTVSLLVLSLMVVLAVVAVVALVILIRRRGEINLALASWFTALIFALIPLRTFLPGQPPIGSWIDILVFFWVEVTLMVVLAVFVAAWISTHDRFPAAAAGTGSQPADGA